jgi:GcrA cell cycle regulator
MRLGDRGGMRAVAHRICACGFAVRMGASLRAAFALSAAQQAAGISRGHSMITHQKWTSERVEQLRSYVNAGLTCSQIALEIGVTRNAVIGKIHRLGLSQGSPAAASALRHPPRVRPRMTQRRIVHAIFAEARRVAEVAVIEVAPVESTDRCSLLELAHGKCRWPINDPADEDFAFCGNDAVAGMSYCAGHVRLAYRFPTRRRAVHSYGAGLA